MGQAPLDLSPNIQNNVNHWMTFLNPHLHMKLVSFEQIHCFGGKDDMVLSMYNEQCKFVKFIVREDDDKTKEMIYVVVIYKDDNSGWRFEALHWIVDKENIVQYK